MAVKTTPQPGSSYKVEVGRIHKVRGSCRYRYEPYAGKQVEEEEHHKNQPQDLVPLKAMILINQDLPL